MGKRKPDSRQRKNDRQWCLSTIPRVLFLVMVGVWSSAPALGACDGLRSGENFWVRLLEPVSSYRAKPGDKIRAIVIQTPECDGHEAVARGTPIEGTIFAVKKVGMGFVHETASVDLRFHSLMTDGAAVQINARLMEIDNARETVKNGVIHGVRATDTPQGRITSRLKHLPTWNPYSDAGLMAYRAAFPIFPEPEIFLPAGTDLRLELNADTPLSEASGGLPAVNDSFTDGESAILADEADSVPARTTTKTGDEADLVNLMMLGTREQVDRAFRAAGWQSGDAATTRSVMREFHAFLAFKNYPSAPISRQLLDGKPSDMNWQKGLDSYERRAHLRLWTRPEVWSEQQTWLGAFTRETGGTLSFRRMKFIHHIDSDLDSGRGKMIRDLVLAGCVDSVEFVHRPGMVRTAVNATGDPMRTDGTLAVIRLKDCANPLFTYEAKAMDAEADGRPRSKLARYVRMQILSYRSDVIRGNIVYGAFDLTRMMLRAHRRRRERDANQAEDARLTLPETSESLSASHWGAD